MPLAARWAAEVGEERTAPPRLARAPPFRIPTPLGRGEPGLGCPLRWSVMERIEGEPVSAAAPPDRVALARDPAGFLRALQAVDAAWGPGPGAHSFHRGGDLAVHDGETRGCLAAQGRRIDVGAARVSWERALASRRGRAPVWVRGDAAPGDLLARGGRLHALIDVGCCAIGDPACDLVAAWMMFQGEARAAGWALWKALPAQALERDAVAVAADLLAACGKDNRKKNPRPPAGELS